MPIAKRKSGRRPLQRLSDQRRSFVLAGLAVGAVFSAAIFRRKRRGEEILIETVEFETPVPATPPIGIEPDEPELADEPQPINAAPAESAAPAPAPTPSPPSPLEPATGELDAEEASILAVLAQSGRTDDDRTAIAVATSLERETADVTSVLRKLGAEGVVSGELQTSSGEEIWAVTERGVRRLGAQS